MHLETTETHASLALALVPPGNVLRDLATLRGKLFTLNSLQGSRAWFDFPVLAWLGRCIDGGTLAGFASDLRNPLDFGPLRWEGNFLVLPVSGGFFPAVLPELSRYTIQRPTPGTGTGTGSVRGNWCHGPFPAGKGLVCAALAPQAVQGGTAGTGKEAVLAEAARLAGEPPRATVYSLALVEMHWYPGPDYGSSWAILSSAIAGNVRNAARPVTVDSNRA
jgi:hypothetical protein